MCKFIFIFEHFQRVKLLKKIEVYINYYYERCDLVGGCLFALIDLSLFNLLFNLFESLYSYELLKKKHIYFIYILNKFTIQS